MDGQKDNDVISTAYRCLLLRPILIVSGAFGQTRRKGGGGRIGGRSGEGGKVFFFLLYYLFYLNSSVKCYRYTNIKTPRQHPVGKITVTVDSRCLVVRHKLPHMQRLVRDHDLVREVLLHPASPLWVSCTWYRVSGQHHERHRFTVVKITW